MKSLALILGLTMVGSAQAADLQIDSGSYSESAYLYEGKSDPGGLAISKQGSQVQLIDKLNKITYNVDLNNLGEQFVPNEYFNYIRNRAGTRVLGKMIKRISLSDLKQTARNEVRGNVNIYLQSQSAYGSLQTKLRIGVTLRSDLCPIPKYVEHKYGNGNTNYEQQYFRVTCLNVETGTSVDIMPGLSTGLFDSRTDRVIGLVADFTVKIFSPLFSQIYMIYNNQL